MQRVVRRGQLVDRVRLCASGLLWLSVPAEHRGEDTRRPWIGRPLRVARWAAKSSTGAAQAKGCLVSMLHWDAASIA